MFDIQQQDLYRWSGNGYQVDIRPQEGSFSYYRQGSLVYKGGLSITADTTAQQEVSALIPGSGKTSQQEEYTALSFAFRSSLFDRKELVFTFCPDYFSVKAILGGTAPQVTDITYFALPQGETPAGFPRYVSPRFDWNVGKVEKDVEQEDILSCQQWLSPPPFAFVYTDGKICCPMGVLARKGHNTYCSMKHLGKTQGVSLQMEGHLSIQGDYETPAMVFTPPAETWDQAVMGYKEVLLHHGVIPKVENKVIPQWWREPIFCGWGQMRYDYRQDHDNEENGNFINVTDYCTQSRYEQYLQKLEEQGVHPGTVIIDMGWALNPAMAEPNPHKWQDMRGFIDREHEKGRHVLLWYTPVVTQGLPDEACLILKGRPVAPDPTNPVYRKILQEQIRKMLSSEPDCLNADGFKIDFTQNTPSEEGVFKDYLNSFWGLINENNPKHLYPHRRERQELIEVWDKQVWGVELLRKYIENLYLFMKEIKSDSVLITHTPNPYFADIVDVLRLNDLDGESENVLEIMSARAKIAKIGCSQWLIDTDNDLMVNKTRWMDYIALQPQLGIPDTYYATHIATSGEAFGEKEYALLVQVFDSYRKMLSSSSLI